MPLTPVQSPSFDRREMLARLRSETFDVLVVGGGITGAGVALDAASRGLRTALVERDDFASGTSSKSSKMVHGGLRYLQQGEVRLVYEALHERQRLRRNAPHLVRVLPFLIPILGRPSAGDSTKSVVSRKIARAMGSAMWMYDLTGGWRIGKLHRRLRKQAALAHMPTMPADRLLSAYLYYDAGADDARLVLTLLRTAAAHGATVVNACGVTGFLHDESGRVYGASVRADGADVDVRAKVVVNAS
ncbi:MAG: FAD-dependent oxidoreductase, partial [Ilumatobacteraceae bacterium]